MTKKDQMMLECAYNSVASSNVSAPNMLGKPVIVTMDMPGASPSIEKEDDHHEHDDSEIDMALSELHRIIKFAPELEKHIQNMSGLEGWVAAKLTKAADYISGIYNWIDYNQSQGRDCGRSEEDCICSHNNGMFSMGHEDEMPEEDCEYAMHGCKCGGCPDCR